MRQHRLNLMQPFLPEMYFGSLIPCRTLFIWTNGCFAYDEAQHLKLLDTY